MAHDLPPLNALRAFEAAARLNSVSQAAEALHVTHGAVSRQIKVLEEHLGVALFVKDGRGIKLTDAGVRLRDASGEAFDRLRSVCSELSRDVSEAPFVLGCSGSLLARWFIPRLGRLQADLPELRLHLSAGEGDLDPRRPGLDALLVYAEPPWPADMQVHVLAEECIGPVLSHISQVSSACRGRPPRHCWAKLAAHHFTPASVAYLGGATGPGPDGHSLWPGFRAPVLPAGGCRGRIGRGDCTAATGRR